jgi:hypothetical protein
VHKLWNDNSNFPLLTLLFIIMILTTPIRSLSVLIGTNLFKRTGTYNITFVLVSCSFLYFLWVGWDWVHFLRRPLIVLLYQLQIMSVDSRWNENWQGIQSTRRKPALVSLCTPQIPHDLAWARTRAAAERSRRRTAWATARPTFVLTQHVTNYGICRTWCFVIYVLQARGKP